MFDLNPPVDHLMVDLDLPDPFDRDAPRRRPIYRDLPPLTPGRTALERARHGLGTRLISLGSALTLDERAAPRTLAR